MTSATGSLRRHQSGFTIIEIVLVLGLIALAGTLMIANFASIADRGGQLTTVETLQAAIRQARFAAASERTVVSLSFDEEKGALVLSNEERFALGPKYSEDGSGEIRFYLVPPAEGLSPFPDRDRTQLQTSEINFAADRSSSPFVVEIDTGNGTPERIAFDPFSSLRRKAKE
ncbi:MAG: type II secretion system protein [Lentimonas sp.]